jgi:hypothetical protein
MFRVKAQPTHRHSKPKIQMRFASAIRNPGKPAHTSQCIRSASYADFTVVLWPAGQRGMLAGTVLIVQRCKPQNVQNNRWRKNVRNELATIDKAHLSLYSILPRSQLFCIPQLSHLCRSQANLTACGTIAGLN